MSDHNSGNIKKGYRPDIDGLRAISVVAVILYHAWPNLVPGGYVGVDVFFVISGFLISNIIFREVDNGNFKITQFYSRRFRRIFPALSLVLVFSLIIGWFGLLSDEFEMLGKHVASASVFISNFTLLNEAGYFDPAAELKPLLHLWSLGIEEQFYIVWPIFLYFLAKISRFRLTAILSIFFLSFFWNVWGVHDNPTATFFNPLTRVWGLISGAIIAYLLTYHSSRMKNILHSFLSHFVSLIGLTLILIACFLLKTDSAYPGWYALMPTTGAVLIIIGGPHSTVNRLLLSRKLMISIGLISYPLYLWHWPLLSFTRIFESSTPNQYLIVCALLLSIACSWISYAYFEKPLRRNPSPFVVPSLISLVALCGIIGFSIYLKDGLPGRAAVANRKDFDRQMTREPEVDTPCKTYFDQHTYNMDLRYCRSHRLDLEHWTAIIGDSHAHVFFPGLSEQLENQNMGTLLLANSGCPPYVGTTTGKTNEVRKTCSDLN